MEMKENFMSVINGHEKSIKNDVTITYKFHSGGETLWSLRAVVNSGFKKYTTDEFNSLRDTFCTRFENECISKLENDIDLELSSMTRSIVLWHLKSVTRLGIFMTKTESAKLFHDYTIDVSNVDRQNTRTSWK